MPPADFRLAPPVTTVDGLTAVPVDVQQLQAAVAFDGATSTAQVDATMTYAVGPTAGSPIFDLRQTITQAWLDGAVIAPTSLAAHDVGAGTLSTVRVIDQVQAAGSVHTLRLVYTLGTPQSQLGGSYPPVLQWTPGPRLRWTIGMSDLNAGRYLEAWFPSNLIFDQFPVAIELNLTGTTVAHSLITNGTVTALGSNHWAVQFPDFFAPLAQLIEIRPTDTVQQAAGSVVLPVSGTTVAIEAWKLTSDPQSLATRIAEVGTLLTTNENDYGPFIGDRFVVFFHGAPGGMEYSGGTTTSAGALAHETFHSWFARGITPAAQADAWWDEGFTTFNDAGANDVEPFDFLLPPIVLCSRAPFQRTTAPNAYSDGSRFFRGVASTLGVDPLRTVMRALYEARRGGPMSTAMLEEHLVSHSGAASLVDAFHRFVYGYADPSPAPRLWLRDAPGHTGTDAWGGAFWNSPDLWVRHLDDQGIEHQAPEFGQDNWFYARVRNDAAGGNCRHFVITFHIKQYAGTEFVYPNDFLPSVAAHAEFDLAPGQTRVVSARWPTALVPAAGTHPCLLAAVHARGDHPMTGRHVWEHANLAQKNLTVVDLVPGEFVILPVVLLNLEARRRTVLEVWRDRAMRNAEVSLIHRSKEFFAGRRVRLEPLPVPEPVPERLMDCGGLEPRQPLEPIGGVLFADDHDRIARRFPGGFEHRLAKGKRSVSVALAVAAPTVVGFKVTVPKGTRPGTVFTTHLAQRKVRGKQLVGGVAVQVRVRGRNDPARER